MNNFSYISDGIDGKLFVMFWVDSSWPVLDCCAGYTRLVYSLMGHFNQVAFNDLSKNCPTQTHHDVSDPAYWSWIKGKYSGIITEPPQDLSLICDIINNSLRFNFACY
jgi:hypothetical protein